MVASPDMVDASSLPTIFAQLIWKAHLSCDCVYGAHIDPLLRKVVAFGINQHREHNKYKARLPGNTLHNILDLIIMAPQTQKQWTVSIGQGFKGLKLDTEAPVPEPRENEVLVKCECNLPCSNSEI